jgi:hypothetical protein
LFSTGTRPGSGVQRVTGWMAALMSTLWGVHGRSEGTRVPQATLVAALTRPTAERLFRTDGLAAQSRAKLRPVSRDDPLPHPLVS